MTIEATVIKIIAESLYLEPENVKTSSNLMLDLGAESIDFLDIIFRLEKAYNIKIPRGEIEKKTKQDLTEEEFAIAGVLQPKGLARLADVMPEIDSKLIKEGLKLRDIPRLYTVGTFVKLVENHLAERTDAASETAATSKRAEATQPATV